MSRASIAGLALSAAALVGLAISEGYTDRAVQPLPGDKWTVGFGTTEGVGPRDTITPPKALERKLREVQQFEGALKSCVRVPLAQAEYDAYVSLAYNIGSTAFCNSTLVRLLNTGDYSGACAQILRWDRFKGQPVRGLTLRRQREHALCISA
jgi:lysozyme